MDGALLLLGVSVGRLLGWFDGCVLGSKLGPSLGILEGFMLILGGNEGALLGISLG